MKKAKTKMFLSHSRKKTQKFKSTLIYLYIKLNIKPVLKFNFYLKQNLTLLFFVFNC